MNQANLAPSLSKFVGEERLHGLQDAPPDTTLVHVPLPEEGLPLDLREFARVVFQDTEGALAGHLPDIGLDGLHLTQLDFRPDGSAVFLEIVWIGLKWQPVSFATVEEPRVSVAFLGQGDYDLELHGTLLLGGLALAVSMGLPGLEIHALLGPGEHRLGELLADLQLDGSSLDDFGLELLALDLAVPERKAHFALAVDGPWQPFGGGFSVERLGFDIEYTSPGSDQEGGLAASFDAAARLGEIELHLSAQHPGPGLGWDLAGEVTAHKGAEPADEGLPLSDLMRELAAAFGIDVKAPAPLHEIKLKDLRLSGNTKSRDLNFHGEVDFRIAGKTIALSADIELRHLPDGTSSKSFSGQIRIADLKFDLVFDKDQERTLFLALYQNPGGGKIPLGKLLAGVSADAGRLVGYDPPQSEGPSFKLKEVLLAAEPGGKHLFALNMDFGLDLSGLGSLPLVGKALPAHQALRLAFEPILLSKQPKLLEAEDIEAIKSLLPEGSPHLPDDLEGGGFRFVTTLAVGDLTRTIEFGGGDPIAADDPAQLDAELGSPKKQDAQSPAPAAPPQPPGDLHWIDLQKAFGPVHLQRLGLGYKGRGITIALDGSLTAGGLEIALYGLGATYNLASHELDFALRGIGIDFKRDELEIGAAFMNLDGDFAGRATIRTESFALSALGAYRDFHGHPSLFIYGFLDYPLGGPPFFFVEGLAAGFGFNRRLTMPPIDQVAAFPLVEEAVGSRPPQKRLTGAGSSSDVSAGIEAELEHLHQYLYPSLGDYFLGVGVKFNSFKLIDSFALLAAAFSSSGRMLIDILGVSTLQVPAESPDVLAFVKMAFKVQVDPQQGSLSVEAQLTDESWILSPDCKLSGGFAYYLWFSGAHGGDFVQTLGGYHPHFPIPWHYPQKVPRLQFNWSIGSSVEVKGDCYYALTPNALMAGGHLQATWHAGSLKAWFKVGADFLIQWKPFHYEAGAHIEVGASYHTIFGTISGHIGADLSMWGPDFSGSARFGFGPIHFSVDFGPSDNSGPPPLSWPQFRASFLPAEDGKFSSMAVRTGLLKTADEAVGKVWVINPKTFSLDCSTLIPITEFRIPEGEHSGQAPQIADHQGFGVAPMNRRTPLPSVCDITVTREGTPVEGEFALAPTLKAFPSGLWGQGRQALGGKRVVHAVGGLTISAKEPTAPGTTSSIVRKDLSYELYPTEAHSDPDAGGLVAYRRLGFRRGDRLDGDRKEIADALCLTEVTKARNALLDGIGVDAARAVRVGKGIAESFIVAPQVAELVPGVGEG